MRERVCNDSATTLRRMAVDLSRASSDKDGEHMNTRNSYRARRRVSANRLASAIGALSILALLTSSCTGEAPEPVEVPPEDEPAEPDEGDEPVPDEAEGEERVLTITVSGDMEGWEPARAVHHMANEIVINTHDTLIDYAPAAEGRPVRDLDTFVPRLAEDWTVSDDGMTYTFELRADVVFNNGDPVDAEAVKRSFERVLEVPGVGSFLLDAIAFVSEPDQIIVADDHTVVFELPQPNPMFLRVIQMMNMAITNVAQIEAEGGDDPESQMAWADSNPTGTGPYLVERFDPGNELVLVANDNHWDGRPYYDRVRYRVVPDAQARLLLLERGDADVVYETPLREHEGLDANPDIAAHAPKTLGTLFMLMGGDLEPWDDPTLKQALAYAIPYDRLIEDATHGLAQRAESWVPTGLDGFTPASPYTHDPDRAAELLEEAGYPDGDGLPTISLALKEGVPEEEEAAVHIQAAFRQVGIDVELEPMAVAAHSELLTAHELPFTFNFFSPFVPDATYQLFWNFRSAEGGCCNYVSYSNPEVDELIDSALVELDRDAWEDQVVSVQEILAEDVPQIPLYHPTWNLAMRADIDGYYYWPDGLVRLAELQAGS